MTLTQVLLTCILAMLVVVTAILAAPILQEWSCYSRDRVVTYHPLTGKTTCRPIKY